MTKRFLALILLAWALLPLSAWAESVTIGANETAENVTLYADDALLLDGTVDGHVTVWNGSAAINGTINGNLFVYGGDVNVADTATIHGDCVILGGDITGTHRCIAVNNDGNTLAQSLPTLIQFDGTNRWLIFTVATAVLTLLAYGTAYSAPTHLHRLEHVVRTEPLSSTGLGLLTIAAGAIITAAILAFSTALVGYVVGFIGYPIALALVGLLLTAGVFGWLAVGSVVGVRLAKWHKIQQYPAVSTIGTVALFVPIGICLLFGVVPAVVATLLIASISMGASTLTRLGTRDHPFYIVRKENRTTDGMG